MTPVEQRQAAKAFVDRWKAAEGNEQREANSFWIELCSQVLGIANPTQRLDFERKVKGRRIDVFYEDMGILIESKSRGIDLDAPEQRGKDRYGNPRMVTPYEQARWYADHITPRSVAPKWVITCNFDLMRIYDLDDEDCEDNYETLTLDELPSMIHRLSFFTRKENSRMEREKELSVKAGEVVGKLYDAFSEAYIDIENDRDEQRSLNVLITRIVFLLYAEDADLLQERNAFYNYLKNFQVAHMRQALIDLFAVLKTPDGTNDLPNERDPYLAPELAAFPYVNGGLFADDIIIPQFTQDTRFILLQEASADFDWSGISPTIFGAVFESTLNPETRRSGGMHYTSVANIHRLTGPLFYDALKDELTAIEGLKTEKERKFKLSAFRQKIASLKFLDPACGSGNFLTETYLSLRKLENRVLEDIYGGQMVMGDFDPIQVSLDQFYGIEVNDFAVEVAKTALWIAELQMLDQTREILSMWIDPLPLKSNENIVCANALRTDWNDILPAAECSYVIGNPPFLGHQDMSASQHDDLDIVLPDCKKHGKLDYVSGWYAKALDYIGDNAISCAFVSTNSICQGEQVGILWDYLFDKGARIEFAYRTFIWNSEAKDQAHVHCVIVGFDKGDWKQKRIYHGDEVETAKSINGYLFDGPSKSVASRSRNINAALADRKLVKGSQPTDGGGLLFKPEEGEAFMSKWPQQAHLLRKFVGADEFINGKYRYCLWLKDADPAEYADNLEIRERLESVRTMRAASPTASVKKDAATPQLFTQIRQPDTDYLLFPRHSSGRRKYLPIGFVSPEVIAGDAASFIPDADLFMFGVLSSTFHNAWMRVVCGRLKSDYRYSPAVFNSFAFPNPADQQRAEIKTCAQAVLDARANHEGNSLADLYDPDKMPDDLKAAHAALDAAVEAAYGVDFGGDEEKIVAHLFKLYAKAIEEK